MSQIGEVTCLRSHLDGIAFDRKWGWKTPRCPVPGFAPSLKLDISPQVYAFLGCETPPHWGHPCPKDAKGK